MHVLLSAHTAISSYPCSFIIMLICILDICYYGCHIYVSCSYGCHTSMYRCYMLLRVPYLYCASTHLPGLAPADAAEPRRLQPDDQDRRGPFAPCTRAAPIMVVDVAIVMVVYDVAVIITPPYIPSFLCFACFVCHRGHHASLSSSLFHDQRSSISTVHGSMLQPPIAFQRFTVQGFNGLAFQ